MGETKEKVSKFAGINKKVIVKPIMRARNANITDPEHEAFFLFGNATIDYRLPLDRHGNLKNPFDSA